MQHLVKLYSIRDAKGDQFSPPFPANTHGEAEREFKTNVNNPQSRINPYPEDYDLYYLGEYDTVTGKLDPIDSPQHIIKGIQVKTTVQ